MLESISIAQIKSLSNKFVGRFLMNILNKKGLNMGCSPLFSPLCL